MQIDEITQPNKKNTQVDEVVGSTMGGLARMAGQAVAGTRAGQAVSQAVGGAKQAFQQSRVGQTLQRAQDTQAQAQLTGNISQLSNAAYQQWNKKKLALMTSAAGQPIENEEGHLTDFVQTVILGGRRIEDMDPPSVAKIERAITGVMNAGNDRAKLQQAFTALVTQALAVRPDPAKQQMQKVNVDNMITTLANRGVSRTNNQAVDTLLQALGIPLK